jgi:class 3 adenylate cyclase
MRSESHVGILFADVSGSTRIYESLGDALAHRIVREMLQRATRHVASHSGRIVKTIGDELMAAFDSPADAVNAAIDIQRSFEEAPTVETKSGPMRLAFRIGCHYGAAVCEENDYFGETVNVAARVVGLAKASQILTTGEVLTLLPPGEREKAMAFGDIEVKGRSEPVAVVQVEWRAQPQNTTVLRLAERTAEPAPEPSLRLVFEGRNWRVPVDRKLLTCGRDAGCDLVLKGPEASRSHATIERRRGKIVLVDHSTNGTHLVMDDRRPIRIHREEYGLSRQGCIIFGSMEREEADTLWFFFA